MCQAQKTVIASLSPKEYPLTPKRVLRFRGRVARRQRHKLQASRPLCWHGFRLANANMPPLSLAWLILLALVLAGFVRNGALELAGFYGSAGVHSNARSEAHVGVQTMGNLLNWR